METPVMPMAGEAVEVTQWGDTPPVRIEDEELDILAFELWQRACCPENDTELEGWITAEEEALCHASCL